MMGFFIKPERYVLLILLVIFIAPAFGAEDLDIYRCAKLGEKYGQGPTKLTIQELDELVLCVSWVRSRQIQEPIEKREQEAIEKNFYRFRE